MASKKKRLAVEIVLSLAWFVFVVFTLEHALKSPVLFAVFHIVTFCVGLMLGDASSIVHELKNEEENR